jgi:hypothetical protein
MERTWTKEDIKELLETSSNAVHKATVTIFKLQTASEQSSETTDHHNGVGYNATDAGIMSSFAKQIQQGRRLSPKQFTIAQKKIMKYAGQLAKIANGIITLG